MDGAAATVDPRAADALRAIDGRDRRLLALRAYLRNARQIDTRWSWTRAELAAFEGSPTQSRYDATIARVRCVFEARHPGYMLYVNPQVRSLEAQLQAWNTNRSVELAARRMESDVADAVARRGFPPPDTAAGRAAFRELLVGYAPTPVPTLAAPGLSLHGRMQAIDFQIRRGTRTVAAPRAATVAEAWHAAGWSARLAAAVRIADVGLRGPLRSPDEPWHYELSPGSADEPVRFARRSLTSEHSCG